MKLTKIAYPLLLLLLTGSSMSLFSFREKATVAIALQNLRCEMLVDPLGIDAVNPRLSWEIISGERNVQQTGYHIMVASSPEKLAANAGDLWDSGTIKSGQSVQVDYAGKTLNSRMACFWKVQVTTNKGESKWSEPAKWSMGLLKPSDWKAKWIGLDKSFAWDSVSKFSRLSARYFRKEVELPGGIKRATVYISGLGLYELYINGKRIGDQVMAPSPTDFTKSVKYNTYDVTENLTGGFATVGVVLGNGRFFTMRQNYKPQKIKTFGYPKMLLQMDIEYNNGTPTKHMTIGSDDNWKVTADGPIRTNNEYDGEEYDANKELTGWADARKTKITSPHSRVVLPGYDEAKWLKAELVQAPGGKLVAQMNEKIRVTEIIKPKAITKLNATTYVMDMGQNMAGWLKMRVKGTKGQKVQLRFAETTKSDGELYVANLRDAKATDVYTLKGGETEVWHPIFVYHGFRYVEIVGYPGVPTVDDFEGQVVNDDLENVGRFETSNTLINKIYRNAYWGIRANYKGMPLDCPQRNERMPWLADHATGSYSESFVFDNAKLYAKWVDDIEESQKPEGGLPDVAPAYWNYYSDDVTWPATYLIVADMLYTQYGDTKPIAKHYDSMKKWLGYMQTKYMTNYIVTKDKYGDWCVPPESPTLIHSKDTLRTTDGHLIATAYYYRLLTLMQRFAQVLNKPEDVKSYAALSANIKTAFNKEFFNSQTNRYSNNSVTSNLLPMYFDMVPQANRKAVFKNIEDKILIDNTGHISTGVIGTQWLMRSLTDNGRTDIAYHIVSNTDYPSWGYMVNKGATTFWELWNGDTASPQMNSQNHVMLLGDLLVWFYEDLAGIKANPLKPAFKQLIMKPEPANGLDYVKASYHSIHGMIKSNWKKEGKSFNWNITIPANSSAIVYVPATSVSDVLESGKSISAVEGVKFLRMEKGRAVLEVGSGSYEFKSVL
ncbi:alpha-L-rhamnosidase [Mucilaginibacter gracilis]|uniref:alpha-L-rhamnosidase n=1 Tax=Mucilaginibacter gracilis TaxID=423350 RepID=A0A495J6J2_9SPHI|nr:alpha-L-rhamnosidase [Mucilaginibacter gracilis]RKR84331.1 alpha-L-rhamnosidase [Mucilaginibacter gracilis]